jgi:hypothetical protein
VNSDNQERVFGFGAEDEMCVHSMYYYPKKSLNNGVPFGCGVGMDKLYNLPAGSCDGTHERMHNASDIEHDLHQRRTFGKAASTTC